MNSTPIFCLSFCKVCCIYPYMLKMYSRFINNRIIRISCGLFFVIGLICTATGLPATTPVSPGTNSLAPAPPIASTKKLRSIPFAGVIQKVDTFEHTITLNGKGGGRIFHIVPETRIMRNNQPASLNGALKGEEVGGAYKVSPEGKNIAVSLRIGPKPEVAPSKKK